MRKGDYFLRSLWEELSVDQRKSVVVYLKMIGHFVYSGWDEFDVDYIDFPEKYITIAECGSESGLFFACDIQPGTELSRCDLLLMANLGMHDENQ